MLILDEISGGHRIAAGGNVGTRWAMHATSTGKAIIAFSENGMRRLGQRLVPLTARTITDPAMSICGPTQRMTEGRRASLGATLCAAAGQLQPRF